MGESNRSGDPDGVCVEVIDDRGRVLEAIYVSEITGVRALDEATLAAVRSVAVQRDR